jgi:phage tail sheath protein FI
MTKKKRGKKSGTKRSTYFSPGVYVEGVRPIEAVGTAVAAFVGISPRRPVRAAVALLALAAIVTLVVRAVRGRSSAVSR